MDLLIKAAICLALTTTLSLPGADLLGTTVIEGDVYIELVTSVYSKSHDNGTCYDVDAESVQNVEAVRWVLTELNKQHINDGNKGGCLMKYGSNAESSQRSFLHYFRAALSSHLSTRPLSIGLRVSMTCRSVARAENLMLDLAIEMENSPQQTVIGVLGTDVSTEAEAVSRLLSSLPTQYRLPLVSYRTTAESLNNRAIYKNFIRTIPSDAIQTKVMVSFMRKLNWTRMAIVHDDGAYGNGGKDALLKEAAFPDICFPVTIAIGHGENRQQTVETELRQKVFNSTVPINGILIFGHDDLAYFVLAAIKNILENYPNFSRPELLFSEASGEIQYTNISTLTGVYVLSPPRRNMSEFYDSYIRSPESIYDLPEPYRHWRKDVYFSKFGCKLPANFSDNTCPVVTDAELESKFPHSIYDQYAIQAALTLAAIEINVRQKLCPGLDFCSPLFSSPRQVYFDQIEQLSVNFIDFEGVRISAFRDPYLVIEFSGSSDAIVSSDFPLYEVYSHQLCESVGNTSCLVKVATMTPDDFVVDASRIKDYDAEGNEMHWPNISKPQCPDGFTCSICIDQTIHEDSILFEPGDMYIVGIVSVHHPGSSPIQCGAIKSGHLDIVEAIRFATTEAKVNYADKSPVGKIGYIIIDSCNDKHIVQERLISLHRLGIYKDGKYIPVEDKIIGYVGGLSSDISTTVAEITRRLGFVQISYASTATTLSIRSVYPNFLRIPSSDTLQAMEMLKIIKEIGANLIQLVHSDSIYGVNGKHAIFEHVSSMDICIARVHKVSVNNDSKDLINALRETKEARVVILFLSGFDVVWLVPALNTGLNKGEFIFIGSDGWGKSTDVTNVTNLAGSITLTTELPINAKFKEHLKTLRPDGSDINHWIRPYMENFFQCYYEWNYNKSSGAACTGREQLDVYHTDYRVDVWSPFAARATLSLLQGAKVVLDERCGDSQNVCEDFHKDPLALVRAIKSVTFSDESGNQVPVFDGNGDGRAGYQFYVLEMFHGKVRYNKIGASDPSFAFDLQFYQQQTTVVSSCTGQDVCHICYPEYMQREATTRYPVWLLVLFVMVCLVSAALVGFLGFTCYRRGCCFQIEDGRVKFVQEYLTPLYLRSGESSKTLKDREESGNYMTITDTERHMYACRHCQHCPCNNSNANPVDKPEKQSKRGRAQAATSTYSYWEGNIPSATISHDAIPDNTSDGQDLKEPDQTPGQTTETRGQTSYINEVEKEPDCSNETDDGTVKSSRLEIEPVDHDQRTSWNNVELEPVYHMRKSNDLDPAVAYHRGNSTIVQPDSRHDVRTNSRHQEGELADVEISGGFVHELSDN